MEEIACDPGPFPPKRQAGTSTRLKGYLCHNKDSRCFDGLYLISYTLSSPPPPKKNTVLATEKSLIKAM